MTVFAGQGDARRSMSLLWRTPQDEEPRPGPKPGLSVEAIVEAAVAVADEQGMAAVSMRAVGERLGRTGMALYTYVPSKNELVDLMYDHVLAELPSEYPPGGGWRAALTSWAHDMRAFYLRHPWVLQVSQARPVLGPNEFQSLETLAGVLSRTGLRARVLRGAVAALLDLVRGAARVIAEAEQAPTATGTSDDEWWTSRAAVLEEVAPGFADRYPLVIWLQTEDAAKWEERAEEAFGTELDLIMDGIETAVARLP
ncbi:TetR/AcrR family transcriptional regulator C-terminal domain-containing protein [Nonomuraea sp. NPDC050536]|uniref:TetR/AcrR family transcriptional regulator C-terminal domain-containing protein n=1 Tax=Nonomuraea sp. NPDC050536 TaxID=3364366 RepID=UPI0037C92C3E